jgi:hypothetical protein
MNTEIVAPQIIDGIEFYVSQDGKQCGVSQIGLARLCGVTEAPIRSLLTSLQGIETDRVKSAPEALKDLLGKSSYLALSSNQQAKVVSAKVAARIIRYYAFEAKNATDTAKYSLGKFAETGIETWIKEVTNFTEQSNTEALLLSMSQTLNLLAADVAGMKAELFRTEGYRAARVTLPGLREWMETLDAESYTQLALPGTAEEELYTLNEWAEKAQNGLVLSRSNKHALANLVSSTYKAMCLSMPNKVIRLNAKGYKLPPVQAYPARHFVLLNMCYSKLVTSN